MAKLTAALLAHQIAVRQEGGFGPESKTVLRAISPKSRWDGSRWTWQYPYSPGNLQGLVDAATILGFELQLDRTLSEQLDRVRQETDYEHTIRRMIQTFMDDRKLPIAGYTTQNAPPPWRHQQIAWHWAVRVRCLYLALKPGCISGDAVVKVCRHGKVYGTTLRDLYAKMSGTALHPWMKPGQTTTKSLMPDGVLRHNEIKQVLAQGTRETVRVLLKSGKSVTCTVDHEIAVPGGWARADALVVGSTVLTNGKPVCRECGSADKVITYKYAKYRGLCRTCAKGGDRHPNWKGGRQLDKDGYVLISGQRSHPNCDRHGCVREHVLVMERKLGRYLTGDERERVHHKNGVKHDNDPENLELNSHSDHAVLHGREGGFSRMDGGTAGTGGEIIFYPREDEVVAIEPAGEVDVYDLVMADPGRNFVADGVIVHNCGKTRIGSDVVRGKFELGQIRAPEQFPLPDRYSDALKDRVLKTRWAIRGGVLVTCPSVVIGEWIEQLKRWQNIEAVPITGDADRKRYRAGLKAWVHVCGYDSLESVEGNEYDGILADEAHYLANEESNRYQRISVLGQHVAWKVAMSGTPIPNMLPSLWAQYYWLDGGRTLGPTYEAYRQRYFSVSGRKLEENQNAETRISQAISRITMFLTMQQAFPDKAQKIQQVMRIPMTEEQQRYYELVRKQQAADIVAGKVTVMEAMTRLTKLLQITQGFVLDDKKVAQQFSSAKLKALEDMLTGQGDLTDRRTIVWSRFKHDIAMISEMLTRKGIAHVQFHGDLSAAEKEDVKAKWNSDYKLRVLVGNLKMGIGVNLHAPNCVDDKGQPARCSTTVFYGLDWRVTELEQAMDRVYRGDQVETCLYRYLLSDELDTSDANGDPIKPIDVRVYESLQDKLNQVTRVNEESVEYIRRLLAA